MTNPNLQWAGIVVEELAACGLEAVCIAPGSRSTPLTLAFARHPDVQVYLHLDERCAAFAALGMALVTGRPIAMVCTSGTAAAEFFPAIIEARQSQIPLLVLTSDRPHELRHSGANQTIDQVKIYGDQTLWSVDAALPEAAAPALALNNLRTVAARAYATANGLTKGPVHLNFPFRKPLEPASLDDVPGRALSRPASTIERGIITPTLPQLDELGRLIDDHPRGVIVCGPCCPGGDFPTAIAELGRRSGYPIFADPLSGVRYGPQVDAATIISSYESLLASGHSTEQPDLTLRFGAVPTSKWLNAYLTEADSAAVVHVRSSGVWADDSHRVTHFLQAEESLVCRGVTARIARRNPGWDQQWAAAEAQAQATAAAYFAEHRFDAAYVAALIDVLPDEANLFVGNSLPIRHVDQFGAARSAPLHVYANRGASGIDGTTSTALGIATAKPAHPLVFLTGDLAFYHDMNGLLAARQHDLRNVTIVLLNNRGGGIFRRLPVSKLDPLFTELFVTPHDLDFRHAAALYGFTHRISDGLEDFRKELARCIGDRRPAILEIQTDGDDDLRRQRALTRAIANLAQNRP